MIIERGNKSASGNFIDKLWQIDPINNNENLSLMKERCIILVLRGAGFVIFKKVKKLNGVFIPPPDKSITHRAMILTAMAKGKSFIRTPLISLDTSNTSMIMRDLGVDMSINQDGELIVESRGYKNFHAPQMSIWCGNSGTTARLVAGLLAPQPFKVTIRGDSSLRRRPMDRVIRPLTKMGANIIGDTLPMTISPSRLFPARLEADVPSAQVKSAVLLAALQIEGRSSYSEPFSTRNHTERMLPLFGADIFHNGTDTEIRGGRDLNPIIITIPGDFSSAAFFMAATYMFEDSRLVIRSVGLNPTRTAFMDIIRSWGADLSTTQHRGDWEIVGEVSLRHTKLKGGEIAGTLSQTAIDELPLLAMLGLFSENGVRIRDADEMKIKESNRIKLLIENFRALGAEVESFDDGLFVAPLKKAEKALLKSGGDHRIAMVNVLLASKFGLELEEESLSCINISFPGFMNALAAVSNG